MNGELPRKRRLRRPDLFLPVRLFDERERTLSRNETDVVVVVNIIEIQPVLCALCILRRSKGERACKGHVLIRLAAARRHIKARMIFRTLRIHGDGIARNGNIVSLLRRHVITAVYKPGKRFVSDGIAEISRERRNIDRMTKCV